MRHLARHATLTGAPAPGISFNYLGRFDWSPRRRRPDRGGAWRPGRRGGTRHRTGAPAGRRGPGGDDRLEITWYYGAGRHREETVTALAEGMLRALSDIVAHCARPGAGGRTPSDSRWPAWTRPPWTGSPGTAGRSRTSTR
ncbi:hypothetical protein LT493_15445 [Streptomyces tricolor]|nr:hypothetical protein [Streptomyces tricolor]